MPECAYVYILASKGRRLYIGITTKFEFRIWQHKNKVHPHSFTARYNIDQLVYFERFTRITNAIAREKELKGWIRQKKIELIVASNRTWRDISLDWGQPVEPFREPRLEDRKTFGEPEKKVAAATNSGDPSLRSG